MKHEESTHNLSKQPDFPKPVDLGDRPWGTETLLCHVAESYIMKRLFFKKGSKGGIQFHRFKDEAAVLISGKMIVRYDDGNGQLIERIIEPGQSFHFSPGVVHQEEAVEDSLVIEVSTPVFNDRVRMEDFYGLGPIEGLPTTQANKVEFG